MRIPSKASRRTKSADPRELRKLRADVTAAFPALGTDQASELVPGKEELSIVKLYAHRGDAVTVYVSGGNPVLFELEKNLYPTVYTLWSYPDLLPAFTTWPLVLEKLVGGADLMLPGIVVPPAGLPQVQKGDLCAIVLVGNRAPVAIGVAAMSTSEMLTSGLKGRGFSVLHTYEDHLWRSGDKSSPPFIAPLTLDPPDVSEEKGSVQAGPALQDDMKRLTLEGKEEENGEDQQMCGEKTLPEASEDPGVRGLNPNPADSKTLQEQMDELLQQCFLHALKCRIKKTDLPLLTSTFLGSHVFSCCLVHLDPILCDCILEKSEQHTVMKLPWDSLLTRCLEKLQPAYQVTFPGQEPIVKKGKICPIDITLAQRASNKKVTVVRNLEAYGLDPCTVAATLQQRCQASTTVAPAPGAKDSLQVQIQGNQVHHLGRLLLEEYQLPRKHIQGLEKAPKPGKKK
uniref:Eukaryotic translation initiation factor 2D n=1 Tax=Myotis myotis TaxID=51298 RepID=A0A7J7SQG8_MYOMY|nr:eukaryotic translation initiation factor 2D [Myotis myotis]